MVERRRHQLGAADIDAEAVARRGEEDAVSGAPADAPRSAGSAQDDAFEVAVGEGHAGRSDTTGRARP